MSKQCCLECEGEMIEVESLSSNKTYYVCLKCNPTEEINENNLSGCYGKCYWCHDVLVLGVDKDYTCTLCGCFLCIGCVQLPDSVTDESEFCDIDDNLMFCGACKPQ